MVPPVNSPKEAARHFRKCTRGVAGFARVTVSQTLRELKALPAFRQANIAHRPRGRPARSFALLAQCLPKTPRPQEERLSVPLPAALLRQLALAAGTSETKEHVLQHFQEVSSMYLCLLPGSSEGGAASSLQTPPSEARAPLAARVSPSPSWRTRCSPSCGRAAQKTTSGHGRKRTSELGKCPRVPLPCSQCPRVPACSQAWRASAQPLTPSTEQGDPHTKPAEDSTIPPAQDMKLYVPAGHTAKHIH